MSRILLVDDESENLRSLSRYLASKQPGWEIRTAGGSQDAERLVQDWTPDVVVTDLVMEADDSGLAVLRAVKARDPLAMVIVVTAHDRKLDRYQAFELGAFDCVPKAMPGLVTAEELWVKTRSALAFRATMLCQIALGRYFDTRVLGLIQEDPTLLDLRSATVTVCFWDIRGFSRFSEALKAKPSLISDFLREYFDLAAEVIGNHDGILDKFIGDGVMALFGAVRPKDEHGRADAADAIRAAADFAIRFRSLAEAWRPKWAWVTPENINIGLGCGIHTGEVLVGNIGGTHRHQFSATGPHVNFAQRLESRASGGQILFSASTMVRLDQDEFVTRETGTISDVKNIPGEFRIFDLVYPGYRPA